MSDAESPSELHKEKRKGKQGRKNCRRQAAVTKDSRDEMLEKERKPVFILHTHP